MYFKDKAKVVFQTPKLCEKEASLKKYVNVLSQKSEKYKLEFHAEIS